MLAIMKPFRTTSSLNLYYSTLYEPEDALVLAAGTVA